MKDFFSSHPRHRLAPDLTISELRELFDAMKVAEENSTKDADFRGIIVRGAVLPRLESSKHLWKTRNAETPSGLELQQQKLVELDALEREIECYIHGLVVDNIQSSAAEAQDAPVVAATTTRPSPNKELELDKEECREIARLIWSGDPKKPIDTVAKEIALGTHVVGKPCGWLDGRKSASAVRKWIKDLCPAPRPGRPRKNP